ncbi:MAG: DnaJ domain-containing protein [Pirellulales bacterium]|nr:DnaJ domain-containing protein [Pirellulales bacterium]
MNTRPGTYNSVAMDKDYYSILGVPRNASQADIQKAYRELARKHHPDMNPNDKSAKKRFQEIQSAFDVLNNAEKREMYDRYGSSFETQGPGGPQGAYTWSWSPGAGGAGAAPGGFSFEDIDLSELLGERYGREPSGGMGDIYGQFRRAAGKFRKPAATTKRGADLQQVLEIPFATAILGGEVQISVQRPEGKPETLAVKIPPGIEDGKKIRVRGHGRPAPRGGKPGDILLTIRVAPHPSFHRRGNQLHVRVPVTLGEAAAGAKIDLPTPHGLVSLKIPPGASSGTKLRVKGHGAKPKNGPPGDLLAEILVVLPKQLSDADRRTIEEIDKRYSQNPRADLRW